MQMIQRRYKAVLAALAAIAMFMATHPAQANQIDFSNGATLTYSVQESGGSQCGAGGEKLYIYAFTVDTYTSSTGHQTDFDSSGGDWLVISPSGNCPGITPGANPATTDLYGSGFTIYFSPEGDSYATATCSGSSC